jgi:hypothetical protein
VYFMFPKRDDEKRLLAEYHVEDTGAADGAVAPVTPSPGASPVAVGRAAHISAPDKEA